MRTFGEIAVTLAAVIFGIAVLATASVDWDSIPMHVEGFE